MDLFELALILVGILLIVRTVRNSPLFGFAQKVT